MTSFKQAIETLGPAANPRQLENMFKRAETSGRTHDLGRALLATWNLETGTPLANDMILRLLVRAGLRHEALRMANKASFIGKDGVILRLKQLLPLPVDHGDAQH